jgi:hypothetical protein
MNFAPERSRIAEQLLSLTTFIFRERYLDWIERVSMDYVDILRSPNNQWPKNERPHIDATLAVRLAHIDARWLGLD